MKRSIILLVILMMTVTMANQFNGYQYIFPKPDAKFVSSKSHIIIRLQNILPQEMVALQKFIHVSDENGPITGTIKIASDNKTILFKPGRPFTPGATIVVDLNAAKNEACDKVQYTFHVSESVFNGGISVTDEELDGTNQTSLSKPAAAGEARIMPNGVSVPGDFPTLNVLLNNNPAPGYIFVCKRDNANLYNMILENDGSPIWYMRTPDNRRDFKVQDNGNISMLVRQDYPFGQGFIEMDHTYSVVDSFYAVGGYSTDEHELQILKDGHYLLIGRREDRVDMSKYISGGQKNATVRETCIQEFTPEHELIFEWRAWDHFNIEDSYVPGENNLKDNYIRFPHMNAIDIDTDGNILLSSRHLSEVTKINRQTGEIIWRLGGENNQFTFTNDPLNGQENQHDIRALGDNHYSLFDNGNEHSPSKSRFVEYKLDTKKMTATIVKQYINAENNGNYSYYMGNVQRLSNGNTFVNWAAGKNLSKLVTELSPTLAKVFEFEFSPRSDAYRVYRSPWEGVAKEPVLFIEPQYDNITLGFNKFGDPDVACYNIYAGASPNPTDIIATSKETLKKIVDLENGKRYYFRVTAVNSQGVESPFSNTENVVANILMPGTNMLNNGDFSTNKNNWIWYTGGDASAVFNIEDGVCHIDISQKGSRGPDIQLRQIGYPLTNGLTYRFEFDAWANASRVIEAKVAQEVSPWINYSKIGLTALSTRKKHYSYDFKMQDASDANGRVVFNFGDDAADVYLDNISLQIIVDSDVEDNPQPAGQFRLYANYPNPFNPVTTIAFDLPTAADVELKVVNVLGKEIITLAQGVQYAGYYNFHFDAADLSSGVYFYSLRAVPVDGSVSFSEFRKMMLIK